MQASAKLAIPKVIDRGQETDRGAFFGPTLLKKSTRPDFRALFRSRPGLYLVLDPDLIIVDASDEYLFATLTWCEEIKGRHLFEVFPDNPNEPKPDGVCNLNASLQRVLEGGAPHRMSIQKYDVRDSVSGEESWVEKFWAPVNRPVFGRGSREITHLLHEVEDVTQAMQLASWMEEQALVNMEQRSTLKQMQRDLTRRERQLIAAQERLSETLRVGGHAAWTVRELQIQLGAPDGRRYLQPGNLTPTSGKYRAYHQRGCELNPGEVLMRAGKPFPSCIRCRDRVLYRLLLPLLL